MLGMGGWGSQTSGAIFMQSLESDKSVVSQ